MTLESILFYSFATVGVASAVTVVTRRNPIIAAIFLILNFFCLAGIYLTLHAQFIAIIQIFVYAGAIMVLFVFVIMLLNLGDDAKLRGRLTLKKAVAGGLLLGLLMELSYIFLVMKPSGTPAPIERAVEIGTVEYIGSQLFTRFLFPFEITSILLTAAIVGALVLAKKNLD